MTQGSEAMVRPWWLRISKTRKSNRNVKRTIPWRWDRKTSPLRNSNYPYIRKNFCPSSLHFSSLYTIYGKQQNERSSWQLTNQLHDFSQRKQFYQRCVTHVLQFNFKLAHVASLVKTAADFLYWRDSKLRRSYFWKCCETYRWHPLSWQLLPRMALVKNNVRHPSILGLWVRRKDTSTKRPISAKRKTMGCKRVTILIEN